MLRPDSPIAHTRKPRGRARCRWLRQRFHLPPPIEGQRGVTSTAWREIGRHVRQSGDSRRCGLRPRCTSDAARHRNGNRAHGKSASRAAGAYQMGCAALHPGTLGSGAPQRPARCADDGLPRSVSATNCPRGISWLHPGHASVNCLVSGTIRWYRLLKKCSRGRPCDPGARFRAGSGASEHESGGIPRNPVLSGICWERPAVLAERSVDRADDGTNHPG
jgi:hypothetical protein